MVGSGDVIRVRSRRRGVARVGCDAPQVYEVLGRGPLRACVFLYAVYMVYEMRVVGRVCAHGVCGNSGRDGV